MTLLLIVYTIVAIALTGLVLMQSHGGGLGSALGGTGSYHTRRGIEKAVFNGTIALTVIFTILSVVVLM
jgi:preprotein translocase subunit SecG